MGELVAHSRKGVGGPMGAGTDCPLLGFPGRWGPPRSPWPGVSVSLCLAHLGLSKRPLCVGVCGAATRRGQARAGAGVAAVSRLLDSKGLFSAPRPTLPTPPRCALLMAVASGLPYTFLDVLLELVLGFFQFGANDVRRV